MMAEGTFELHPGDALYPETVLELSDVPQTLYVRGNPEVLSTPALSIIGARKASPYGLAVAELAAKVAVEAGVTVVSGGASVVTKLGLGCGQRRRQTRRGAGDGRRRGLPAFERGAYYTHARYGWRGRVDLSVGHGTAQVCLSAPQSRDRGPVASPLCIRGRYAFRDVFYSRAAMDLGRELLAVPGSILSPESRGTNYLIANGACCIVDEESIEMAISRIYGILRYSRPDAPGIAT